MLVFTKIPVMVAVPVMVVFAPAAIAFPVPRKEALSVVVGHNPTRAEIGRTSPVSGMPLIMASNGIPVSLNPYEFGAWSSRDYPNHTRRRWRSDLYSNRHLAQRE